MQWLELASCKSALNPLVVCSTDRSLCCFVVYSTRRFVVWLSVCHFVLVSCASRGSHTVIMAISVLIAALFISQLTWVQLVVLLCSTILLVLSDLWCVCHLGEQHQCLFRPIHAESCVKLSVYLLFFCIVMIPSRDLKPSWRRNLVSYHSNCCGQNVLLVVWLSPAW